jgi:hypothetical protein
MFLFGNGNVCEHESPSLSRLLGHSLVGCVIRGRRRLGRGCDAPRR